MQYALVDGQRAEAVKAGRGTCPSCGSLVVAKCGSRIVHHWAHLSDRDCDPWQENETPWHREWKRQFPEECRERPFRAENGEIHRADVVTPTGIVVEIQNSPMSDEERKSREEFYKNLVWIVNGRQFASRFHILHMLPDPEAELSKDLVWYKAKKQMKGTANGMFWRRSENPDAVPGKLGLVQIHSLDRIKKEVLACYSGHHQFDWDNARAGWLDAKTPVFIDFGDEWVWHLLNYDNRGLRCVRRTARAKLIHDLMNETDALNVATKFYPIK